MFTSGKLGIFCSFSQRTGPTTPRTHSKTPPHLRQTSDPAPRVPTRTVRVVTLFPSFRRGLRRREKETSGRWRGRDRTAAVRSDVAPSAFTATPLTSRSRNGGYCRSGRRSVCVVCSVRPSPSCLFVRAACFLVVRGVRGRWTGLIAAGRLWGGSK